MTKIKFNRFLALASTLTLISGSQAVYAQNDQIEEVVVTGFKASLQNSVDIKRSSDSLVEAVSAEDIGKLPDRSIAESLSRLPGLAMQRVNGRAQIISIRGMGPDFNTTLLNGRQQVNTGDNRSVEFDQYPSEFITSAVVYKTPDASVIGQGIGGTVDMQTIKPLDHGKRALVVSGSYEWNSENALNSDADDKGHRATVSWVDQNDDGTFGYALGFSTMDSPTQIQHFNAWGYAEYEDDNGNYVGDVLGGAKPFVQSVALKRDSYMGAFQFKPSDNYSTQLDVFYSDFEEDNIKRGIELPLAVWGDATLRDGYTVRDGIISEGYFDDVRGVIRSDGEFRKAKMIAAGWNQQFQLSDAWSLETDLSYSKAEREDKIFESYSAYVGANDSLKFTRTNKGFKFDSSLDYLDTSNIKLGNLQSWGGSFVEGNQMGYYKEPNIDDELTQFRINATRELNGPISSIEFGINYDEREKRKSTLPEAYLDFGGDLYADLPSKTFKTDLSFLGFTAITGYDPLGPINDGTYRLISGEENSSVADKEWTVKEEILTAYVKFGIDTEVAGLPLRGNFGVQYVDSDQSSSAWAAQGATSPLDPANGNFERHAINDGITYSDWLPSLNLNLHLTDNDVIRMGVARTLTRSRMDDLRASSSYSLSTQSEKLNETSDINNSPWSAGGGNARLKPWISDNYDLAYEHYFDDNLGVFTLQAFYKELDTFVYQRSAVYDFTNVPHDPLFQPKMFLGFASQPVNGEGGIVKGAEASATLMGELVSDALSGFGMTLSASYTESNIKTDFDNGELPGLSRNVQGATVFYESENGFSARVSANYRSKFLGELAGFDAERNQRMVKDQTTVDAQISYEFLSGSLEGLTVSLEGINLTDEPMVTYSGTNTGRIVDYDAYGSTYSVRLNYKFF